MNGNELTLTPAQRAERLSALEARIEVNLCSAYEKIVEVGRCLLAAKEQKLVPHGQWEAWVTKTTGMNERQAQRWMQIAREVPEGSYLSRLEVGKMRMILALPEEQREPLARKTVEEDIDTRTLKAEIKRLKGDLEQAENETRRVRDFAQSEDRRVKELEQKLHDALEKRSAGGITPEAQAVIDKLNRQLADAKTLAQVQAEKRQKAQQELLELKQAKANGQDLKQSEGLTYEEFAGAVGQLLSTCGAMPQMGREFATMNGGEKRRWQQWLETLTKWVLGAQKALDTWEGSVSA